MVLKPKKLLFALCALQLSLSAFALNVPSLTGRVNDYANIIGSGTKARLEDYLESLDSQTGVQIAVLTVPALGGEDIASFSIKVAEQWQLGHSGKDDGALLVVALAEHDVRIEVGYGLEDRLTDAKCGLIIRNVIVPQFREGDYSQGIFLGVQNMGGIASNNAELVSKKVLAEENQSSEGSVSALIFMIIWLVFFFLIITSKGGLWKWLFLSNLAGGGRSYTGRSYSPPRSSGFSGGSSFHGGGGHFGGGGASGKW